MKKPHRKNHTTAIKTSFMELLQELTSLTKDDTLVLATMKEISASYRVRFVRKLVPVRLVGSEPPISSLRRGNLGKAL